MEMNKFELKEKLIELSDLIEKKVGEMMSKGTSDEETGKIRSEVYIDMSEAVNKLHELIYNIY